MSIVFSCAVSHAPGMTAWAKAAPEAQRDRLYAGFETLRDRLAASGAETLILLTSEHWANFFLDHIGAFCIGRAERYRGPGRALAQCREGGARGRCRARQGSARLLLRGRHRAELRL